MPLLLGVQLAQAQTKEAAPWFADSNRLQRIRSTELLADSLYRTHAAQQHFSGYSYALVTTEGVVYSQYSGLANRQQNYTVGPATAFRIASMTKSMTALAILKLRDEGKLKLDDPVLRYVSELGKLKPLTVDAPPMTIRHLLTHAAGFPEDNPWGDRQLQDSEQDLLTLASKASLATTAGTAYEYSNLGYALLGQVITRVTGQPYQRYITRTILQPLGMKHTEWEFSRIPAAQLAKGYRYGGEQWTEEPMLHDGSYGAMGGLITTMEDFSRYVQLHLQAWPARDEKENAVIRRSSLREMHQPANFISLNPAYTYLNGRRCPTSNAYAFGLRWITDCEQKTYVGHSGGLPGFGSNWAILPEYGIGVVFFANETYASTTNLNMTVLDTIVRRAGLQKRTIPVSPILQQRSQELQAILPHWQGAVQSGIFAENFFADRSLEEWKKLASSLWQKIGPITSYRPLKAINRLRGSFFVHGAKGKAEVFFTLSPEPLPKIQELRLTESK